MIRYISGHVRLNERCTKIILRSVELPSVRLEFPAEKNEENL